MRDPSETARLQTQLAELQTERDVLLVELAATREEIERSLRLERKGATLAQLIVAGRRLHGTLDRAELLVAIKDVLHNLIGSEQVAVFELLRGKRVLDLATWEGIDADRFRSVPLGEGPIGECAATGKAYFGEPGRAGALAAVLPLSIDGRVTGAIAVFGLLPQKAGLDGVDRDLLGLLAAQAATLLYCAALHGRAGGWAA